MGKGPEHSHVNRCGFQNGKNDLYRNKIKSFDNQHSMSVADFKTRD